MVINVIGRSDIIGYYPFDEGTGSTIKDISSNSNDGTITGATWTTKSPNGANNLTFSGTSQYVDVGDITIFESATDTITIEMIVEIDDPTKNYGMIFDKFGGTPGWSYGFYGTSGKPMIAVYDGSKWMQVAGGAALTANTRYHLVCTYDGTGVSAGVKWYYNGVLQSNTDVIVQTPTGSLANANTARFMDRSSNSGAYDSGGTIEVCRMYNRVVSQSEVTALYKAVYRA